MIAPRRASQARGPGLRALFAFAASLGAAAASVGAPAAARAQDVRGAACACTRELRSLTLPVTDARGRAVTTWRATVRRARTGELLARPTSADPTPIAPGPAGRTPVVAEEPGAPAAAPAPAPGSGTLVVIDDASVDRVRSAGDTLVVEVTAGRRRGRATVVVATTGPASCPCHVRLVRAPRAVVVR